MGHGYSVRPKGDGLVRVVDLGMFPPEGTTCADCGRPLAAVYAGEGEDRVALCWDCDEGAPSPGAGTKER